MIPREKALRKRKVNFEKMKRPLFALKYDPRLPAISSLQAKHWRAMTAQDQYLTEVFLKPPLVAFRKQSNLKDILIRSKVPPIPKRLERNLKE